MKKRVMLTGATGTMGWAVLQELLGRTDRFDITILVRESRKNRRLLRTVADKVKIVWGDLTSFEEVKNAVRGSDYVLHVGGMVSPKADYFPYKTRFVNVTAANNIAQAVLAQPNADEIKVCYVGSVAQTSDRNAPVHWGRTGDPICVSVYDHYAISKTAAEKAIVDSGIKNWVCLRQSGILSEKILNNYDPIMFHVPLRGVLEWATVEDSGRALANLCEDWVDPKFWNRFYNIGSGADYRLTNYDFECKLLKTIYCPKPEKIFNPEWFVLRNFHGQWYLDSDVLEEFLHFRENMPVDDYFKKMQKSLPWFFRLAKLVPAWILKLAMIPMAYKKRWGTQYWIKKNDEKRISAYYGSLEKYRAIKPWAEQDLTPPSQTPTHIDHGYDENKPVSEWTIADMQQAAAFRGGECLSEEMQTGDSATRLKWRCFRSHEFEASPALILLGGHWCPHCQPTPWRYDEEARHNPFFAQVWRPLHDEDENNVYGEEIFNGWEKVKIPD